MNIPSSSSSSIYFVRSHTDAGSGFESNNPLNWNSSQNESKDGSETGKSTMHLSMQQLIDDYEQKQYMVSTNIQKDENRIKRRKTRFDIGPDEIRPKPIDQAIPTFTGAFGNETKQEKLITNEQVLIETNNYFQQLNDQYNEYTNTPLPVTISFEDEAFKDRIRLALQKNFDYIERVDNLARERLLQAKQLFLTGGIPALSKFGTTPHPPPNNSSAPTTAIRSRFQDRYNKARPVDKRGIGAGRGNGDSTRVAKPNTAKVETTRIYVSGFPTDITEEEIEILFAPQGKIKKIKLYTDSQGNKKGDCLITYQSSESAHAAVAKLHKLNIGDGKILSVSKAEFTNNKEGIDSNIVSTIPKPSVEKKLEELLTILQESTTTTINHRIISRFHQCIPLELPIQDLPVIFVWNAYETNQPFDELREIESDMLVQASNFGAVKAIHLFDFSESSIDTIVDTTNSPSTGLSKMKDNTQLRILGCIAIAFDEVASAIACQQFLAPQYFCARKLFTFLHLPIMNQTVTESTEELIRPTTIAREEEKIVDLTTDPNSSSMIAEDIPKEIATMEGENIYSEEIQKDLEDVEDFLNSLL